MKKGHKFLIISLLVIMGISCLSVAVVAADLNSCSDCHNWTTKPDSDVRKFILKKLPDRINPPHVSTVDKSTCKICHNPDLFIYAGGNTYTHQGVTLTNYSVGGVVYGAFLSQESIYKDFGYLHNQHNTPLVQPSSGTGTTCSRCHYVTACVACHVPVEHEKHYMANPINPNTGNSIITPNILSTTGKSVKGADGKWYNYTFVPTTCAAAECHGTLPNPIRKKTDGNDLCFNCHTTGIEGHDLDNLEIDHDSVLPASIILSGQSYSVSCTGCHVQPLTTEHEIAAANDGLPAKTGCGYCHGNTALASVKSVISTIKTLNSSLTDPVMKANNRACTKCHFENPNITSLFGYHPEPIHVGNGVDVVGGSHVTCNTCHERAAISSTINTLAVTNPSSYSCLDCHKGGTYPKAPVHKASFTDGSMMDVVGMHPGCNTCHDQNMTYTGSTRKPVDDINSIIATKNGVYSCTDCHTSLDAGHKAYFNNGAETYNMNTTDYHRACNLCHGNEKVSGIVTMLKGTTNAYNCNVCHNGTAAKAPAHITTDMEPIVGYHPNNDVGTRCDKCHGQANFAKINVLTWPASYDCTSCHNSSGTIAGDGYHMAKADSVANPENVSTSYHQACATCHGNSLVQPVINSLKRTVSTPYMCSVCHNAELNLEPKHKAKMSSGDTVESTITDYHLNSAGQVSCGMCHGTDKLPEGIITTLKAASSYLCSDCHKAGSAIAYSHKADFGTEAVNQATTDYHKTCQTCHDSAAAKPVIKSLIGQTGYDCIQCHNGTVTFQALHQGKLRTTSSAVGTVSYHPDCLTCHNSAKSAAFISSKKGTTAPYLCSDCHGDLTLKHQSTTNLANPLGIVNCSWCHSATDLAYVNSNLIGVHMYPNVNLGEQYNCETCHSSNSPVKAQVALKLTSCDACHNGTVVEAPHPDSQYYPKHVVNPYPVFMPEYSPNCSACHNGNNSVIKIHTPYNIGCKSCHFTEAYKPAVVSLDANCTGCHTAAINPAMDMEAAHKPFHNADTVKYPATAECLDCHAKDSTVDGRSLLGVHKKDADSTVTCDTCHASTVRQSVKDAITANNVSCQACHATGSGHLHPVAANGYTAIPAVDCSKCHATNTDGTAEVAAVHQKAADEGKIPGYSCNTCHNPLFEGSDKVIVKDGQLDMKKNGVTIYCTDCHNGTLAHAPGTKYQAHDGNHINSAGYGAYKGTYNGIAFDDTAVDCSKCHASLDTKAVHDTAVHPNVNCNSCHQSANTAVQAVIKGAWSRVATKAAYTCADCHNTLPYLHKPEHVSLQDIEKQPVNCAGCHTFNYGLGSAVTFTGSGANIHAAGCNLCHNNAKVDSVITPKIGLDNSGAKAYGCAQCHDGSKAKTHNKMHDVTAFTSDGATGCTNCHTKDVVTQHSAAVKSTLNCDTCHGSGAATLLPSTPTVISANLSTNLNRTGYTCESCHGNVSHQHKVGKNGYKANAEVQCSSCHAINMSTGESELAALHEESGFGCAACHNSTFEGSGKVISGDGNLNMNRNGQTIYCTDCHNGTLTNTVESGHTPAHVALHSSTGMDCSSCHGFNAPAQTAKDITAAAIHPNGCNTCHSGANLTYAQKQANVLIATKVASPVKPVPVYKCEDCHGPIHTGWENKHNPAFPSNTNMTCADCHNNYLPTEHVKALASPTNSALGYEVQRSTDKINWTTIGKTTATSFANTGLLANTTYYYKVRAYDGKPNYSAYTGSVSVKTLASTAQATTVNPNEARYASGNNGDSGSDPSSTYDHLSRLTDTSDSTYTEVRENGSSDQYIFVRLNNTDAKDFTKVELKFRMRYYEGTNLIIYPYNSNGTSINTTSTSIVKGPSRSSSSSYITETIDVTKAAQAMNGYGWIKFRIKPDPSSSRRVYIAKVEVVLTKAATSGGIATNPPGTLTSTPNDTTTPTVPSGLTGTSNYYDRVDLTWTASSDQGAAVGENDTCALCHSSSVSTRVSNAVTAKNANCSACHDIHGDIATVHTAPSYGYSAYTWNCGKCHTRVLSDEHANRGLTCATCHSSSKAKVRAAISSTVTDGSNLRCSVCHTGTIDGAGAIHTDLTAPHLTGIFPTATDADCLICHTSQKSEFASTRGAYHVITGLTTKATSGQGTYVSPWKFDSYVGCKGCHGNNNDGKAQAAKILKRPYTYTSHSGQADMLCFLCHDRATYGAGGDNIGKTGFSRSGKNYHNIGDHKINNVVQCSWCHTAVPHGTSKAHLIVTKSEPNSVGNTLTNFYHVTSGTYEKRHCGSDINACDDHKGY